MVQAEARREERARIEGDTGGWVLVAYLGEVVLISLRVLQFAR